MQQQQNSSIGGGGGEDYSCSQLHSSCSYSRDNHRSYSWDQDCGEKEGRKGGHSSQSQSYGESSHNFGSGGSGGNSSRKRRGGGEVNNSDYYFHNQDQQKGREGCHHWCLAREMSCDSLRSNNNTQGLVLAPVATNADFKSHLQLSMNSAR